ncbi:PotD/PotF family extracellular solute-binding protein [Natrialbaceae archaeon GCM10025810]|uniref:ABC transporter substrate-binding protein n=1 Tax=Halovalidus salilacus TaxID=3075124 RepID=UPI003606E5B3
MHTHDTSSSRRTFLKTTGAAIGVASLGGCLGGGDDGDGGTRGSADGELEESLNIFQWGDYWPDGFVQGFEDEYDVDVNVSNYSSNEEMFNKLRGGDLDQYDLLFPSDYMVNVMHEQDMISPLDVDSLENFGNLADQFEEAPYDPGDERYSVPYQWGTSGIGWNEEVTGEIEVTSWETMWDEEFEGQMTMLDDMRETIGAALKSLGYSLNTTEESEVEEAKDLLIEQKDLLATYDSSNFKTSLINEENSPVHGWSGDVFAALWETYDDEDESSPVNYAIPEEGGVVWVDTAVVSAEAQSPNAAHVFIDHFLDAENGAEITNYTYYGSPNEAAEEHISEEILEDESIYPDDETMERLEYIENIGDATTMYDEAWTEIQNA